MKTLRTLIRLDAVLLALFGYLTATYTYSVTRSVYPLTMPRVVFHFDQERAPLLFLGTAVVVLAIVLYTVSDFALIGHRRRLGTLLAAGNLVIAVVVIVAQPSEWARVLGGIPPLVLLIMAMALAWTSRRPMGPDDAAAELAALQIPDDVREALRRQIGEAAAQEERNRLARDLHDSIKQQLFSINVGTATAQERWERDPEGARAMLADVRRSAKEAMVEMQALLHQLRPQALASSAGLVEALREQCEALGYRTGSEVTLEMGDTLPDDRLPPGAQETLFRIAQEALGNVARHARARKVRVWLGREGESVRLRIEDDGQGFDPEAKVSGMGLRNLRERAVSLRGTLDTSSAPGRGTTVGVTIPLSPPAPFPVVGWTGEEIGLLVFLFFSILAWLFIRPLLIDDDFLLAFSCLNFIWAGLSAAGAIRRRVESALAASPGLSPAFSARLRYRSHWNRALAFFLTAAWSPWAWRLGEIWSGWTVLWIGVALFCVGMTVAELISLHRVSEARSRWWSLQSLQSLFSQIRGLFSSDFRRFLRLLFFAYVILMLPVIALLGRLSIFPWQAGSSDPLLPSFLRRPPGTAEILCLVLGAALLLYIRSRQPRTEGAAA